MLATKPNPNNKTKKLRASSSHSVRKAGGASKPQKKKKKSAAAAGQSVSAALGGAAGALARVDAPMAVGYTGQYSTEPVMIRAFDGSTTVKKREYLGKVNMSTNSGAWMLVLNHKLSPSNKDLFPYLSTIAPSFEQHQCVKCVFTLIPACPTNSSGSMQYAIDPNSSDPIPDTSERFLNLVNSRVTPVWQAASLAIDLRETVAGQWKFTGNQGDPRLNNYGRVMVAIDQTQSQVPYASLIVDYEWRFKKTQLGDNGAQQQAEQSQYPGWWNQNYLPILPGGIFPTGRLITSGDHNFDVDCTMDPVTHNTTLTFLPVQSGIFEVDLLVFHPQQQNSVQTSFTSAGTSKITNLDWEGSAVANFGANGTDFSFHQRFEINVSQATHDTLNAPTISVNIATDTANYTLLNIAASRGAVSGMESVGRMDADERVYIAPPNAPNPSYPPEYFSYQMKIQGQTAISPALPFGTNPIITIPYAAGCTLTGNVLTFQQTGIWHVEYVYTGTGTNLLGVTGTAWNGIRSSVNAGTSTALSIAVDVSVVGQTLIIDISNSTAISDVTARIFRTEAVVA